MSIIKSNIIYVSSSVWHSFFLPFYTLEKGWVLVIPLFTLMCSFTVDHVLIK
jgi:hypothetical protein